MREAAAQSQVLAASPTFGMLLYRNNSGALQDPRTGRVVRYGLCNDSTALNERLKSSDLVGLTRYLVQPADVGRVLAVFTGVECKAPGWHMTPSDKRAKAQEAWHDIIRSHGGFAGFATAPEDLLRIIGR